MMMPHLEEEVLAGYALDALEDTERDEARRHLATCEECADRLSETRALLALLPADVDDADPSTTLRSSLRAAAAATMQAPTPLRPATPRAERATGSGIVLSRLALAAVVLAAAIVGGVIGSLVGTSGDPEFSQGLVEAITGGGDTVVLPMQGTQVAPDVRAALLAPVGVDRVYVVASNVPPPPPGQAYNLYLFEDGKALHAATLTPDSRGRVSAVLDAPLSRFDAMELDVQPVGTTTPGGPSVLKSTLP